MSEAALGYDVWLECGHNIVLSDPPQEHHGEYRGYYGPYAYACRACGMRMGWEKYRKREPVKKESAVNRLRRKVAGFV